jgi:hypothetical protein
LYYFTYKARLLIGQSISSQVQELAHRLVCYYLPAIKAETIKKSPSQYEMYE